MTDPDGGGQVRVVREAEAHRDARDPDLLPPVRGQHEPTPPTFEKLFDAHWGFVCRILHGMGAEPGAAEDLAQDVFVVVHRKLDELDPARDVRSWLWGIARRVASTYRRTRARAEQRLRALPDPPQVPTPQARVEQREKAAFVADVLRSLPEEQREVFVLMEIESMSAPAVAQALGTKVNTVYSRLRIARERFKHAVRQRRKEEGMG